MEKQEKIKKNDLIELEFLGKTTEGPSKRKKAITNKINTKNKISLSLMIQ